MVGVDGSARLSSTFDQSPHADVLPAQFRRNCADCSNIKRLPSSELTQICAQAHPISVASEKASCVNKSRQSPAENVF